MAIFGKKVNKDKEQKREKTKRHTRVALTSDGKAHEIIREPWFSEKALIMTEKGIYTFAVPSYATKATIAGAIREIYNVKPRAVRIVNTPGKAKAMRVRRGVGVRAERRKAYVYLNKGDTIQFA